MDDDVTTSDTPLVVTLRALDKKWQSDNWPHDDEPRPRSYYAVAADRIAELEVALGDSERIMTALSMAPKQCRELVVDDVNLAAAIKETRRLLALK